MTTEVSTESRAPRNAKKARPAGERPSRRVADASAMKEFLDGLDVGVKPSLHVNGHSYTFALVTVDFGSPLKQVKLTSEQVHELNDRLRKLAKDVLGRDQNVRVSHDAPNGIFWASVV